MATAFSSSELAALERKVDVESVNEWKLENVWDETQKTTCIEWVNKNKFSKVCLQFPDDQLTISTNIVEELKSLCADVQFYILADTSYGSCCVDEIAAAHVEADAVIHFGNACQSKVTRLPVFYVFPHFEFDTEKFVASISTLGEAFKTIVVYFEPGYHHVIDDASKTGVLNEFKLSPEAAGKDIAFEKYTGNVSSYDDVKDACVFVGRDDQTFFNVTMSIRASTWFIYRPEEGKMTETDPMTTQWIKRRLFHVAKCKEAKTIGLVVATLTADGYLDALKHIQDMARARGKRTYIISVGRIDPPKLANFLEIDCFILIGCPFNNIYTSRDFYRPMVSVFEAELAMNPAWLNQYPDLYSLNFKDILPEGKQFREFNSKDIEENDVSLVTGNMIRGRPADEDGIMTNGKNFQLMVAESRTMFGNPLWGGLDPQLGRTEPVKLTKGLSGIPTNYTQN